MSAGYVYVMVHCEDFSTSPLSELAWERAVVHALGLADKNKTPRMIHVRRGVTWNLYNHMHVVSIAAGFGCEDVFCGDILGNATVKLPGDKLRQAKICQVL